MIKNAFYFSLTSVFVLKIFKLFYPEFFSYAGKQLDKKAHVNFKIHYVIYCKKGSILKY